MEFSYLVPVNYMSMLCSIYEKFKYTSKWDPTANICFGGLDATNVNFSQGTNTGTEDYINQCLTSTVYTNFKAKYGHEPFDAIGIHPYNTITLTAGVLTNYFKAAMDNYTSTFNMDGVNTSIPVWLTEVGDTAVASQYIEAAYAYPRITRLHWFKYYYSGNSKYSIVDSSGNPIQGFSVIDIEYSLINNPPPVVTIGSYNMNPTNKNITVTATTDKGTLNFSSYTFTSNGSCTFTASDSFGNVTNQVVTITNIDKTPPMISIGAYDTSPTNQNMTITATVNEGTLNQNSYVFTANGSFIFSATDAAGNTSFRIVKINNINKG